MKRRGDALKTVALTVVVALALGSCGGDSEEPDNGYGLNEDEIARADYVQAANALCAERREEMTKKGQRLYAQIERNPGRGGAKELIEEVVAPGFEREIKELRELTPPPGDEEQVRELIAAMADMVERTRKDLGVDRGFPYRKTEKLAALYGVPDCGRP